jgi:predicted DNA-binding transcriptional regulator AlpA
MNDTTIDDPIVPGWSGASAVSGRSIPSLKRDVKAKRFPPPLELGPNRIGWRRSWIEEWLESRPRRHYALLSEAQGRAPMEAGEPQPRFVYRATPEGETAPPSDTERPPKGSRRSRARPTATRPASDRSAQNDGRTPEARHAGS